MEFIEIGRRQHVQRYPVGIVTQDKYTLGQWDTVEVSSTGDDLPNRSIVIAEDDFVIDDRVAAWKSLPG